MIYKNMVIGFIYGELILRHTVQNLSLFIIKFSYFTTLNIHTVGSLPPYSFESMDSIMPYLQFLLESFTMITSEELIKIISVMNKTTCSSDPFPSKLLMSHLPTIIDTITHMINLCISTSVFPSSCKSAIVLPLIKKPCLDPQVLKNYRPVSNLSFLSKVIEKVISSRILTHIADNDLIDKFQSAYRCGHSTETALLRVYCDIVTMVGKGNGSCLVLLDLSAAFDTIDHDTLFVILEKYIGITGSALQLLKSYFSDRSQRVLINDVMSGGANIVCGVPQGSVQGPIKFCLHLLPLEAILNYHGIGYHIYADDTQLYISFIFKCNNPLASLPKLNNCISDIRVWMIKNKLKINDSKTEFIVFRSPHAKQDLSSLSVHVGDSIIQQSSKVRDLGVIFDPFLSFDDYISSVCRSTHFHLRNIGRIRHFLSHHATAQLIHALISTRLDYCNSVLYNLPKSSILRLQRIQNQAARILTRTPRRDHIIEVLIDLHWLRIEERIVYKILFFTFKAFINRTAPLYLCELIEQQRSKTNTRLAGDAFLLKLPPPSRNCADTFYERSFLYGAPYAWNKLNERVRRLTDFNMFRSEIKTLLFLRYFDNWHDIVISGL